MPFDPDTEQYIVWAIGGVEETAFRHFTRSDSMCTVVCASVRVCMLDVMLYVYNVIRSKCQKLMKLNGR